MTDNANLPKGPGSAELPGTGVAANQAGVYEHPASKTQVIVMPDAKSTGQQDALVRMGFVRKGDAPSRPELNAMQQKQAAADRKAGLDGSVPASTGTFGAPLDTDAPRHNPTSTVSDTSAQGQSGSNDAVAGATDASTPEVEPQPEVEPADASEAPENTKSNENETES